jgi:hypothetical protein
LASCSCDAAGDRRERVALLWAINRNSTSANGGLNAPVYSTCTTLLALWQEPLEWVAASPGEVSYLDAWATECL